jgi:glycosyltransferase involved in cell wall biosynthesis
VFPSLWYETYGLVVAEAAAYGVPVIVSDITAAAERVEQGVTGWIFRSGDAADLVRCLQLLENDALVSAVGAHAYQTFWDSASTNATHARDLTRIYQSILDECAA